MRRRRPSAPRRAKSIRRSAGARNARTEQLAETIKTNTSEAERALGTLAISVGDAIRLSAGEAERKLAGVGEEVARGFTGKVAEIAGELARHTEAMNTLLSQKSGGVVDAIAQKGRQFAEEITSAADQAVRAIDERGLAFSRAILDNGTEIARMINAAGDNAAGAVSRTMRELHAAALEAIEQSQSTANATVKEMLETHNMLRADTTALFERLREANIMLQEVLSGSHENMSALENTLMQRVSEFVAAMQEVTASTGEATGRVETTISNFRETTSRVVGDLAELARQFDAHGRELGRAITLIDDSNRRSEQSISERRSQLEQLVTSLDARSQDIEQRLIRFAGLLDESLEAAASRARDVARIVSESSAESMRAIGEQHERGRENAEEERRRTAEAMRAIFAQAAGDTGEIFRQASERFAEVVAGMKQMAAEMRSELEATRAELRRGIFELPQETAESAAQMRRVIVDQIEALAELNRIVARHGRSLDTAEPVRREAEPLYASGGGRGQPRPIRPDMRADMRADMGPPPAPPAPPRDITGAPTRRPGPPNLSPVQGGKDEGNGRNGGWLSDLLTRASRDEAPSVAPSREPVPREPVDSIDSLSVDIARMIDHDAAAELWDRYKRGERGAFNRRLYTPQGQKAFDEIRAKYRADPEFRQTVEHYIHEFERLLDDVSRGDRGPAVARNYLTSDTGKVYTMLAHAAGRFD